MQCLHGHWYRGVMVLQFILGCCYYNGNPQPGSTDLFLASLFKIEFFLG